MSKKDPNALVAVHTRLFKSDVDELKRIAKATGNKWQVELRQTVRRTLRGERREVVVLKEKA